MATYKENIVDIELTKGTIHRSFLNYAIGKGDNLADHIGVRVYRNGLPVDLTGIAVQGYFRDPQGNNIAITSGNLVGENVAVVVLPQACYNYDGQFVLAIKLVGGGVTGTVRIVDGTVDNANTGGAVAPTGTVPTYQEVLALYADMEEFMSDSEDRLSTAEAGISNAMQTTSRLTGRTFNWVQGAIRTVDGSNNSSTTRIRTPGSGENYYQRGLINHLVAKPGYKFMVFLYSGTSYTSYLGVYNGYSIEAEAAWRKDLVLGFDDSYYFRIVLAADDDSEIDVDASENLLAYVSVDTSLTYSGVPADAKTVGDRMAAMGISQRTIRIMDYNIGDYVWGFTPGYGSGQKYLTDEEYVEKLANYKRAFGDIMPDILTVQEFNQNFTVLDGSTQKSYPALDNLFTPMFRYKSINAESYNTSAIFANIEAVGYETKNIVGIDNDATWRIGEYYVGGHLLAVATGYLSSTGENRQANREAELCYLCNYLAGKNYEYIAICGDFNCNATAAYEGPFSAVTALYPEYSGVTTGAENNFEAIQRIISLYGYNAANSDSYWGATNSYVDHDGNNPGRKEDMEGKLKPLEQIILKGNMKIRNCKVRDDLYDNLSSDHMPLVVDVLVY